MRELLMGCRIRAIWVLKMSNNIPFGSLDDSLMKEGGILITEKGPVLFVSLAVKYVLFS